MGYSRTVLNVAASAVILIALAASASGQSVPRSSPPASPPQQAVPAESGPQQSEAPSSPEREDNPTPLNEMGKLFLSILPKVKSPSEALDDFSTRAKEAGDSFSNLARPSSVVTGRMACTVAANGAPDCNAGADRLCQSKGFKQGKSLDTDAAEKCSAKVYLPGYKREPGDCRTENYVTRALCQ